MVYLWPTDNPVQVWQKISCSPLINLNYVVVRQQIRHLLLLWRITLHVIVMVLLLCWQAVLAGCLSRLSPGL